MAHHGLFGRFFSRTIDACTVVVEGPESEHPEAVSRLAVDEGGKPLKVLRRR